MSSTICRRHVRRLAELLRVEAIGARDQLPVDVLQIVAGTIVPVLAELGAVAMKRAAVEARRRALRRRCAPRARGRRSRARTSGGERGRGTAHGIGLERLTAREPLRAAARRSDPRRRRRLPPGNSAARGGAAPAAPRRGCPRGDATLRPSSSARAFAPSTSAWPARGPAPHFTHCRTGGGTASPARRPDGSRARCAARSR